MNYKKKYKNNIAAAIKWTFKEDCRLEIVENIIISSGVEMPGEAWQLAVLVLAYVDRVTLLLLVSGTNTQESEREVWLIKLFMCT